jgi:glycosyltransferase involved in cell wall biosynthesis
MDFSIVIPAKNEEANIGRCLDSIFAVEWDTGEFEVIVVDNGSSDRTAAIAALKGAKVLIQPGLSISGLRNFGALEASGEILAFIDADCTVGVQWLRQASYYLERPEVVCFGSPPEVPENPTWVQSAWFMVRRKAELVGETEWLESMNMFIRRDPFLSCGGFDEILATCEDYDLSLRLKRYGKVLSDRRIVAVHHGEAATLGHFFRKELWRGKSNFAGVLQHGFRVSELPSLVAPTLHCLLIPLCLASFFIFRGGQSRYALTAMILWQTLLLLKSFRKYWPAPSVGGVLQLYCLINIYLFARGISVFQGK